MIDNLEILHQYVEGQLKFNKISTMYYRCHELANVVGLDVSYIVCRITSLYSFNEIITSINNTFKYYKLEELQLLSRRRYKCGSTIINFVEPEKFDDFVKNKECYVVDI